MQLASPPAILKRRKRVEGHVRSLIAMLDAERYSLDLAQQLHAIVAAVAHRELCALTVDDFQQKLNPNGCFIDVKACFDAAALRAAGLRVWRL